MSGSWYLYEMVAQNMLRTFIVQWVYRKIEFDCPFDVTKGLQQIEIPDLLHTMCANCYELPSNISTHD